MAAVPTARVARRWWIAAALLVAAPFALRAEARRIVSIVPATTEMLFAMGAGDRVVAVGSYDRFPVEVAKLPRVGALLDPDVERIIAIHPDLVVLYGTQTELRTQLERASRRQVGRARFWFSDATREPSPTSTRAAATDFYTTCSRPPAPPMCWPIFISNR